MSASPDQLLVTPTEDQKGSSVVFDVPISELKKNYKLCTSNEKSLAGKYFLYCYLIHISIYIFEHVLVGFIKSID